MTVSVASGRQSVEQAIAAGILRCPACRGPLGLSLSQLVCTTCAGAYPVSESGVPLLISSNRDTLMGDTQEFWRTLHDAAYGDRHGALTPHELTGLLVELDRLFQHRQHLASVEMPRELSGLRVLEVGSGAGAHSALFATRGARVCAIDLTLERAMATARKLDIVGGGDAFTAQADARALPFPGDHFDIVYSNGVLHHSPDIQRSVAEVHRVLKPGGRAVIMLYAKNSFLYRGVLFPVRGVLQGRIFRDKRWLGRSTEWMSSKPQTRANPWTAVFSAGEIRRLFANFSRVSIRKGSFTFDQIPVIGRAMGKLAGQWTGLNPAGVLVYDRPWRNETAFELSLGRLVGWGLNILATK